MADIAGAAVGAQGQGMLCPTCRVDLVMSERQGIEIDYCPKCRGVWLDRGELDKIIDRSLTESAKAEPAAPFAPQPVPRQEPRYGSDDRQDRGSQDRGYQERGYQDRGYDGKRGHDSRRRESFFSQLFD